MSFGAAILNTPHCKKWLQFSLFRFDNLQNAFDLNFFRRSISLVWNSNLILNWICMKNRKTLYFFETWNFNNHFNLYENRRFSKWNGAVCYPSGNKTATKLKMSQTSQLKSIHLGQQPFYDSVWHFEKPSEFPLHIARNGISTISTAPNLYNL